MCNTWHAATQSDNCTCIADQYGISVTQLEQWNPTLGSQCGNFSVGCSYCVASTDKCQECDSDVVTSTVYLSSSSSSTCTTSSTTTVYESAGAAGNGWSASSTTNWNTWNSNNPTTTAYASYATTPSSSTYQWLKPSSTGVCEGCVQPGDTGTSGGITAPGGVSTDGKCGQALMGADWTTCANSHFGYCCSTSGYCGNSTQNCQLPYCDPLAGYCVGFRNGSAKIVQDRSAKKWTVGMVLVVGIVLERLFMWP